jgi:hypothetical protein
VAQTAITIGYPVPADFPAADYNLIHTKMQQWSAADSVFWEYAFAWNAVAYRFTQMADHDEAYRSTLTDSGDAWVIRYTQEKELFGFFTAGLSALEAFFYAMHSAAGIVDPISFPMASDDDLRSVNIKLTRDRFARRFPTEHLAQAMASLVDDPSRAQWERVRNVLIHRQAPGRVVFASTGGEAPPDKWKLEGLALDDDLTWSRRRWLSQAIAGLTARGVEFVEGCLGT